MRPIFLFSRNFPPFNFTGITLLIFVIVKRRKGGNKPELTDTFIRHETCHVYQQLTLFITGVVISTLCTVFGASLWWWWWLTPIILPFATYVLCWVAELLLPPYDTAYRDICFERESRDAEKYVYPQYYPFSFLKYQKHVK